MGKHKRRHADVDVEVAADRVEDAPEISVIDEWSSPKKMKKHKQKKSRGDNGSKDEGSSISRLQSPTKSQSKSTHSQPAAIADDDDRDQDGFVSPQKSKKRKHPEEEGMSLIMNGDFDHDSDRGLNSSKASYKKQRTGYAAEETDNPIIWKVLQDMKKGLNDASVGDPGILASEELESDDVEIFVIQCPENVNLPQLLDGTKLKLVHEAITSLGKGNDERYESVFLTDENERTITVALPDALGNTRVVSSKLAGHIVVREAIDELQVPALEIEEKSVHVLPADLKERHPVFGTDFRIPLKSLELDRPSPKKSKKKKKQREDDLVSQHHTSSTKDHYEDVPIFPNPNQAHTRSKRKHANEVEEVALEDETETNTRKKKKKNKRSREEESYQPKEVEFKVVEEIVEVDEEHAAIAKKQKKKKKDRKS